MARQKNDGRGRMGGRQKGTPNKTTSNLRDILAAQWNTYYESGQFAEDIRMLDPQARAILMEKYAAYLAPKMKSVDLAVTGDVSVKTIEERLAELTAGEEDIQ